MALAGETRFDKMADPICRFYVVIQHIELRLIYASNANPHHLLYSLLFHLKSTLHYMFFITGRSLGNLKTYQKYGKTAFCCPSVALSIQ